VLPLEHENKSWRETQMSKVTMTQLKLLKPYAKNPRKNQPVDDVASSIKEYGFTNPILIDKDHNIVAGHTRFKAAEQLGLKTVPCLVLDLPEVEIIEPETNQKHERFKQLVFLYDDSLKYADHFKRIQAIKYELGYDTDDQIIETLLEVYNKNK